jgi:hypothetical protein
MENAMTKKITGDDCVQCLKTLSKGGTAAEIAFLLNTDSRAVATALRKPVNDGRVKINYSRGLGMGATYKFVRSTPAKVKGGAA